MQMDVLQWTAEEQALLDLYEGSNEEKKEKLAEALLEVDDTEMIEVITGVILKL